MPVLLEPRNRRCVIKPRIDPQGTAACCRESSEETTRRDGRWRQSRWPRCRPAIWFLSIDRHGRTMRPVATTGSRTFPPGARCPDRYAGGEVAALVFPSRNVIVLTGQLNSGFTPG